jgi:hypothetical protein
VAAIRSTRAPRPLDGPVQETATIVSPPPPHLEGPVPVWRSQKNFAGLLVYGPFPPSHQCTGPTHILRGRFRSGWEGGRPPATIVAVSCTACLLVAYCLSILTACLLTDCLLTHCLLTALLTLACSSACGSLLACSLLACRSLFTVTFPIFLALISMFCLVLCRVPRSSRNLQRH